MCIVGLAAHITSKLASPLGIGPFSGYMRALNVSSIWSIQFMLLSELSGEFARQSHRGQCTHRQGAQAWRVRLKETLCMQ